MKIKTYVSFIVFFFMLNLCSAINFSIESRLNNMRAEVFLITNDECSSKFDYLDFKVPQNPNDYSSLFSVIENNNLSVDCWNAKEDYKRNLTIIFKVYSPGNYSGNLSLMWSPLQLRDRYEQLNLVLKDLKTEKEINMTKESKLVIENEEPIREFLIESEYLWCGDGKINLNERCDGENLRGKTCKSFGYAGGEIRCNNKTCQFDLTSCIEESGGEGENYEKNKESSERGGGGGGEEYSSQCVDECKLKERRCISNNSYQVCGNFDNDSCLEWGPPEACLNIIPNCKEGFCYECLSDRDCKEGFCIEGKCKSNCEKDCKQLGLTCGRYLFCDKILDCGRCEKGFCNDGICSNLPKGAKKISKKNCNANYECTEWSACKISFNFENVLSGKEWFKGKSERICVDKNKCYSTVKEEEDCIIKKEINIKESSFCGERFIEVYDKENNLLARLKDPLFSKKNILEVFLKPEINPSCDGILEQEYNLTFIDKVMLSLDIRKMLRFVEWIKR